MTMTKIVYFCFLISSLAGCISANVSNYTSTLTTSSEKFSRVGVNGNNYYYEAIPIRVSTTGTYTFKSVGTTMDTFGYLYQGNFYPEYPEYNIVAQDDDGIGGGKRQFQITAELRSDITYILVHTTYAEQVTGPFSIEASGPGDVFMNMKSCPVNEVLYENHCYYLDGNGGQCLSGYSVGPEEVLPQLASSFSALTYKTQISDNCCIKTTTTPSNYGSIANQCNKAGSFSGGPTLNGSGCNNYTGQTPKQLTLCVSN